MLKSILISTTLFYHFSALALSTNQEAYYQQIAAHSELADTVNAMGYSIEEAARAFSDAQASAELTLGHAPDLGTLAICARGSAGWTVGIDGLVCTTFWNAYRLLMPKIGQGGGASLSLEAIYFRTANRDVSDTYCYGGANVDVVLVKGIGGRALIEMGCGDGKGLKGFPGFLLGIRASAGVELSASLGYAEVKHIKKYR